jgi:hypothetical protein
MRIYYEDRKTGSIYSIDEFAKLIVRQGMNTDEVLRRYSRLPSSMSRLLEEAEAIAVRADSDRGQLRFGS